MVILHAGAISLTPTPCVTSREDERSVAAHLAGVALHHAEVGADERARSILLMTSRSDCVMPGPPLRGILSPPATSMT